MTGNQPHSIRSGEASSEAADGPSDSTRENPARPAPAPQPAVEIGGRGGLDPTRYGDWEKNGRCIDF